MYDLDDLIDGPQGRGGVHRDRWDRAMLVPGEARAAAPLLTSPRQDGLDRRVDGKGRLPYTAASSLANMISDHSALDTWKKRSIIKGLSEREDLAAQAAALPPIVGNAKNKALMTPQEIAQDRATNRELDRVGEEAAVYANRDYKANWGTAVHSFTDPGAGTDVPERMRADVDSWRRCTTGWEFIMTEAFVRNDTYQAAGTFDHLVRIPWRPDLGAILVDKKTGILHDDQFSIQLEVYASGELYDPLTDTTAPWPVEVNRDHAIVAHIPMGEGRTELELVDLREGRLGAQAAIATRAHRRNKNLSERIDPLQEARLHVAVLIEQADSVQTLRAIHAWWTAVWHSQLTELGNRRIEALARV